MLQALRGLAGLDLIKPPGRPHDADNHAPAGRQDRLQESPLLGDEKDRVNLSPQARQNAHSAAIRIQSSGSSEELSPDQERELAELKQIDREVRAHERAHLAAAGEFALGGASFEFTRGPDGSLYAIAGEVQIDVSPVRGDPDATWRKAEKIRRAALAPANPSMQDRQIAAKAAAMAAQASREALSSQAPPLDAGTYHEKPIRSQGPAVDWLG